MSLNAVRRDPCEPPYTMEKSLGKGISGEVFRGTSTRSGSPVAVKESRGKGGYRALGREKEILSQLKQAPHIVQLREGFKFPDQRRLVFNLATSFNDPERPVVNLRSLAEKYGITTGQIVSCGKQLLEALLALKQRGIVHADLKAENVVYNPDSNQATLIDFANSASFENHVNNAQQTTVTHCAPEMFFHREQTDFGVDMWGLGVTLFHLYAGKMPFPYPDTLANIRNVLGKPPYIDDPDLDLGDHESFPHQDPEWKKQILSAAERRRDRPEQTDCLIDFLDQIFRYENRITVEEALEHPLFANDMQVTLDCGQLSWEDRKKLVLKVAQLAIPLTSSCLHLPLTPGLYEVRIADLKGKTLERWSCSLTPNSTIYLPSP